MIMVKEKKRRQEKKEKRNKEKAKDTASQWESVINNIQQVFFSGPQRKNKILVGGQLVKSVVYC